MSDEHTLTRESVEASVRSLGLGEGRLHRSRLAELVTSIGREEQSWRPLVRHDPDHRWYARLLHARNVEVWLIGWETGQDTRFHDHGGSSGAFYVASGRLTEEYGNVEGRARLQRRTHRTGRVVPFGPAYVHNLGNSHAEAATSIHAYSPPLATMTYYHPGGGMLVPYETLITAGPDPEVDAVAAASPEGCFAAVT